MTTFANHVFHEIMKTTITVGDMPVGKAFDTITGVSAVVKFSRQAILMDIKEQEVAEEMIYNLSEYINNVSDYYRYTPKRHYRERANYSLERVHEMLEEIGFKNIPVYVREDKREDDD